MTLDYNVTPVGSKYFDLISEFIDSGEDIAEVIIDGNARVAYVSLHKTIERHRLLACKVKTKRGHIYLVRNPDETST